jgi:serine/threonine-protein kinase
MAFPVPSVRVFRETAPVQVDRAITRALAKAPADRFPTAHDFSEALGGTHEAPAQRPPATRERRTRWLGVGALLLLLLTAALGILRPWRKAATPLERNLLAVVPFDVSDRALAVWSEGVVDFLSRGLDGAGTLRSVAPSLVMADWNGRSDRASATAVAQRVGAGLAVTGNLSRRGPDSVDIRGVLLDIARGSALGEVSVSGAENRVGELVDSLGIGLLRILSRDRPVAAVRRSTIGTAALPALKAFLRGEQFYRRALFDSALAAYAEAIEQDSVLAFASYRMGEVLGWSPVTAGAYAGYDTYLAQAHLHNHGQGERDSLIIAADSAWQVAALSMSSGTPRPDLFRIALDRLDQLVQTHPRDPEAWYELGEKLTHTTSGLGKDDVRALSAFDRAIALDSSFLPPWEHVFELAVRRRGADDIRRYALAFSAIPTTTPATITARLASVLLLDSTTRNDTALRRAIDSAPPVALLRLGHEIFLYISDSSETAIALLRLLDAKNASDINSDEWFADPLMRHQLLAYALMTRGHLREAAEVDRQLIAEPGASSFSWFRDPFFYLALLGVLPAAEVDSVYRVSLQPGVSVALTNTRVLLGLPRWAARHDTTAIERFGLRMREAGRRSNIPSQQVRAHYLEAASQAYLALSRGDSAAALRRFDTMPACPWTADPVFCDEPILTNAIVLAARGVLLPAAAILDTLLANSSGVVTVLARLERAEVAERLQDRETARRHYQSVLDAWRRADPELAPYVGLAKAGLARVTGRRS